MFVLGVYAYLNLPREQDPSINFNWVQVITAWPGASALDVERRITIPLEEGLSKVTDIKFISSVSREGLSSILVRFNDLDDDQFYRKVSDLRREAQVKEAELPDDVRGPNFLEITSANAFPTATLVVTGPAKDATLRRFARIAKEDLKRWPEIDRVDSFGDSDPEVLVHFSLDKLAGLGVNPANVADTVKSYFRDLAAGSVRFGEQEWLIRLSGTSTDPGFIGKMPIVTKEGEVPLRSVAEIYWGSEDPQQIVHFEDRPAVMMSVFKQERANNLRLLDGIRDYIEARNRKNASLGIEMVLVDDQTVTTREALSVMQNNALIGFVLVFLVTWAFLGLRLSLFTTLGIPFVLAATLFTLFLLGQTLNVTVLLALVIVLGMLVDDAVVVVEGIHHYMQRGLDVTEAAIRALRDVVPPVTSAVLTTIAAFLPLLFLPGLLGDFMRVVPIVVVIALLFSLVEAYWLLPAHIVHSRIPLARGSRTQEVRARVTRSLRRRYTHALLAAFRRPRLSLSGLAVIALAAAFLIVGGWIKMDFFASDFYRLFYVNVVMPPGTSLDKTSETLLKLEQVVKTKLEADEVRAVTTYAGIGYTEKEPVVGHEFGQIFVTLLPGSSDLRSVNDVIEGMRSAVERVPGPLRVSFERRKTGPPTSKPISIKLRGDSFETIRAAAEVMENELSQVPGIKDLSNDDAQGKQELVVRLNPDAITRAGLDPAEVIRMVRLFAAGEIVAEMDHEGEEVAVRVRAAPGSLENIGQFLANGIALQDGSEISLSELLYFSDQRTRDSIRHYNLRRAITVEGDIDPAVIDTVEANALIQRLWSQRASDFPDVDIDLSGELDDIAEGVKSLGMLFMAGLGLIFLILGTQFKSYLQPMIVLGVVPMAFVGVVFGLFITRNPLSLYTLYGVIALAGIAANDAIVLISATNRNLRRGYSKIHALVYAARRRVVPILITSLTTMVGLFSLAAGLGGESLLWGPVATSIVWGLAFSTVLTLFFVPIGYQLLVREKDSTAGAVLEPVAGYSPPMPGQPLESASWRDMLASWIGTRRVDERGEPPASDNRAEYEQAVEAFTEKDYETAIRAFQSLADQTPDNAVYNLYASAAHVEFMRLNGWDIGYMARAKRYLSRARKLTPRAPEIARLEKAINALETDLQSQSSQLHNR